MDFSTLKAWELKAELSRRKLSTTGTNIATLITRLRDDEAKKKHPAPSEFNFINDPKGAARLKAHIEKYKNLNEKDDADFAEEERKIRTKHQRELEKHWEHRETRRKIRNTVAEGEKKDLVNQLRQEKLDHCVEVEDSSEEKTSEAGNNEAEGVQSKPLPIKDAQSSVTAANSQNHSADDKHSPISSNTPKRLAVTQAEDVPAEITESLDPPNNAKLIKPAAEDLIDGDDESPKAPEAPTVPEASEAPVASQVANLAKAQIELTQKKLANAKKSVAFQQPTASKEPQATRKRRALTDAPVTKIAMKKAKGNDQSAGEDIPIIQRLKNSSLKDSLNEDLKLNCYVFIPAHIIPVNSTIVEDLQDMIKTYDDCEAVAAWDGYYLIFKRPRFQDLKMAKLLFQEFEGKDFQGNILRMKVLCCGGVYACSEAL